jgi:hypothetical protein
MVEDDNDDWHFSLSRVWGAFFDSRSFAGA